MGITMNRSSFAKNDFKNSEIIMKTGTRVVMYPEDFKRAGLKERTWPEMREICTLVRSEYRDARTKHKGRDKGIWWLVSVPSLHAWCDGVWFHERHLKR